MSYLLAYLTVLISFGIFEAIWLSQMAIALYRPILGDMMIEQVRIIPAAVFYLSFPIGLVVFAVMPALREESVWAAFWSGMLLGALCYATYDLTNYATLKTWTLQVTLIDIAYGAIVSATCSSLAYWVVQAYAAR